MSKGRRVSCLCGFPARLRLLEEERWTLLFQAGHGARSPHLRPPNFDNRVDVYWPCTAIEGEMHNLPPPTWDDWMPMLLNWKLLCTQYNNYHWGTKRVIGTVRRDWPVTKEWRKRGMKKAMHYRMLAVAHKSETEEEGEWRENYGLEYGVWTGRPVLRPPRRGWGTCTPSFLPPPILLIMADAITTTPSFVC